MFRTIRASPIISSIHSSVNVVVLNGTTITQSSEHYNYRSYLETLLTFGTDVAGTRLMNAYWYRDTGDMLQCDPTSATVTAVTNRGFITRWDKLRSSKELQLFGAIAYRYVQLPPRPSAGRQLAD